MQQQRWVFFFLGSITLADVRYSFSLEVFMSPHSPLLAELPSEGFTVRGGFNMDASVFEVGLFRTDLDFPETEPQRVDDAEDLILLNFFPEFEDLVALRGCHRRGCPMDALSRLLRELGLTGDAPFNAERAAKLMRTTPAEMELLFIDAMKAIQPTTTSDSGYDWSDADTLDAAWGVVEAYAEAQAPRFKADADSVFAAHELPSFAF
jgi:hypothetical protein